MTSSNIFTNCEFAICLRDGTIAQGLPMTITWDADNPLVIEFDFNSEKPWHLSTEFVIQTVIHGADSYTQDIILEHGPEENEYTLTLYPDDPKETVILIDAKPLEELTRAVSKRFDSNLAVKREIDRFLSSFMQ